MNFKRIYDFSAREVKANQDPLSIRNELSYRGRKLGLLVQAGDLLWQFQVKNYYLLCELYDGFDYASYRIILLTKEFKLLSTYISPNCAFKEAVGNEIQFQETPDGKLVFYLGEHDPWTIEILPQPKILVCETLLRIKRGWWLFEELPKLASRSYISVCPLGKLE